MYWSYIAFMQPEEHRKDIIQNQTLPTTTIAHQHQSLVVGVGHPIHDLIVFRKPHKVVNGVIHLHEYPSEESLALLRGLAPSPAPFLSWSDVLFLDHLLDKLFDCHCFHISRYYLVYCFLRYGVSPSFSVVLLDHRSE